MALPNVAYFSMEIAIDQSLATYSGIPPLKIFPKKNSPQEARKDTTV